MKILRDEAEAESTRIHHTV